MSYDRQFGRPGNGTYFTDFRVYQDLRFSFPFGRGDWNLADAYTDAAPHFRRVFFSRFFRLPLSF